MLVHRMVSAKLKWNWKTASGKVMANLKLLERMVMMIPATLDD
jgi:hypothetical protein